EGHDPRIPVPDPERVEAELPGAIRGGCAASQDLEERCPCGLRTRGPWGGFRAGQPGQGGDQGEDVESMSHGFPVQWARRGSYAAGATDSGENWRRPPTGRGARSIRLGRGSRAAARSAGGRDGEADEGDSGAGDRRFRGE